MRCETCGKIMGKCKRDTCPNELRKLCICIYCYIKEQKDTKDSDVISWDIKAYRDFGCWSYIDDDTINRILVAEML